MTRNIKLTAEELNNSVVIDLTGLVRLRSMKNPNNSREAKDVRRQMKKYNMPGIRNYYSIYLPCYRPPEYK